MKLRNTLTGHDGQVLCARFGPDGRRVVSGGRDKSIAIWKLRGGKHDRTLEGHERAVTVLGFTAGGELLSGDAGGALKLWSWPRGKLLLELDGHDGPVFTLGASADGTLFASGGRDRTICVWERDTGELVHRYDVGERGMSFVFSGDGEHLVSGSGGDTLCFWSLATGELAWVQEAGPGTVGAFELDRNREWVVSRGWRGPVTIWSASSWGYTTVLPIVEKGLGGATLRPGYEQVVCIYEGGIGLYEAEHGKLLEDFEISSKGVYDLDVSPDGRYAITASADELVRIFEFEDLPLEEEAEEEDAEQEAEEEEEEEAEEEEEE